MVRRRYRYVRYAEHLALQLEVVPEKLVILVQVQGRAGLFLHLPGGQEMIEVGMGMNDADDLQPQRVQPRQDQLGVAARIDHNGVTSQRIADDRAVALQRADGKGFTNQCAGDGHSKNSWTWRTTTPVRINSAGRHGYQRALSCCCRFCTWLCRALMLRVICARKVSNSAAVPPVGLLWLSSLLRNNVSSCSRRLMVCAGFCFFRACRSAPRLLSCVPNWFCASPCAFSWVSSRLTSPGRAPLRVPSSTPNPLRRSLNLSATTPCAFHWLSSA